MREAKVLVCCMFSIASFMLVVGAVVINSWTEMAAGAVLAVLAIAWRAE